MYHLRPAIHDFRKRIKAIYYHESDPREFHVYRDRKLVYLIVSKVACTSIKMTIGKSYGTYSQQPMAIHDNALWNYHYGNLPSAYRSFYKFAFVRNPFDRLVSCYRDKIIFDGPNEIYQRPYFSQYNYSIPPNISFRDFVNIIINIPDTRADRHFKSQHSILYFRGKKMVDFIGKFENMKKDWQNLAQRYHFDTQLARVHKTKKKAGVHSDYRLYYTEELVQLVYKRYRDDIELFGYQDAYHSLLNIVRDQPSMQ